MTNGVICTTNLKKSYSLGKTEVPILHGIDMCIQQGEYVALMGPSWFR